MPKKSTKTSLKNSLSFLKKASDLKDPEYVSTGYLDLDLAIARGKVSDDPSLDLSQVDPAAAGGFPLGYLVELFGSEGSGKSSLAHRVCGFAQKQNLDVAWFDVERSYQRALAIINGVDVDNIALDDMINVDDPDEVPTAEVVLDRVINTIKAGYKVIVIDSLAALIPEGQLSRDMEEGKGGIGLLARTLSTAMPKICSYAKAHDCLVICINQTRQDVGVIYGDPTTTPGGKAAKFYSSVRVRVEKRGGKKSEIVVTDNDGNERIVGRQAYVRIMKNRFGKPVSESIDIITYFEPYFPDVDEILFDQGRKLKLIIKRKSEFKWDGESVEGSKKTFIDSIRDNGKYEKLVRAVREAALDQNVVLPPELQNIDADGIQAPVTDLEQDGNQ